MLFRIVDRNSNIVKWEAKSKFRLCWTYQFQVNFFPVHSLRVRTHDQNSVPLIICNKIVSLLKINVPSCQINVPSCQINVPQYQIKARSSQIKDRLSQISVPRSEINVPLSNRFLKFLRQNHDPRNIYLKEGHIFVSLFDHVYGPYINEDARNEYEPLAGYSFPTSSA